ncbi:MAG: hypothetical protein H7Y30_01365 [Pyrinomonadaceae bacterium]|nr:hypothetical protein [Pyrinomonadaceae bacterium]
MIDLRCHLLNGIVCGAGDFAEAVEMCRQAAREGVQTIVLTERWEAGSNEPPQPFNERQQALERLQHETSGALALKSGYVLRFHNGLAALVERYGASITLGGGRYVLVSLPALCTPVETEEVWEQLMQRGFSVIVAAPEGSPALRRNPQRLEKWTDGGAKLQLNAASVTGAHGREAQRFALHCAKEYPNRVMVASNMRVGEARHTSLAQAREILARHFGKRRVQALFQDTPAAILETAHEKDAAGIELNGRDQSGLLSQLFKLGKAATGAS